MLNTDNDGIGMLTTEDVLISFYSLPDRHAIEPTQKNIGPTHLNFDKKNGKCDGVDLNKCDK